MFTIQNSKKTKRCGTSSAGNAGKCLLLNVQCQAGQQFKVNGTSNLKELTHSDKCSDYLRREHKGQGLRHATRQTANINRGLPEITRCRALGIGSPTRRDASVKRNQKDKDDLRTWHPQNSVQATLHAVRPKQVKSSHYTDACSSENEKMGTPLDSQILRLRRQHVQEVAFYELD